MTKPPGTPNPNPEEKVPTTDQKPTSKGGGGSAKGGGSKSK